MARLRAAISKAAYPNKGAAFRAIGDAFKVDFETRTAAAVQQLSQYVDGLFAGLWSQVVPMIRSEVSAQVAAQAPQVIRVTEQPITQVIEKPLERVVEKTIERVVEEKNEAPIRVIRDKQGRISKLIRGDKFYAVQRNDDGLITGIK